MSDGLRNFLAEIGLEHHFDMFLTRGFDEESDISHLTLEDLQTIGIVNASDIRVILKAAQTYKTSRTHQLYHWLRKIGLVHYYESFVQSSLTDLNKVASLSLPDDELYDELEITLPGHQRRLERAVRVLSRRLKQKEESNRVVVTEGWWGFPAYLQNAKYPFLCVRATIRSTNQNISYSRNMEFMVDSGSDVSTLRDDIIQELRLEAVGQVRSCGVYGSQRTMMYQAYLTVGDQTLEIEVISSSYDSVGSRVLRYFGHQIDADRHTWYRMCGTSPQYSTVSQSVSNRTAQAETVPVLSDQEPRFMVSSDVTAQETVDENGTDDTLGGHGDECGSSSRSKSEACLPVHTWVAENVAVAVEVSAADEVMKHGEKISQSPSLSNSQHNNH